MRAETLQGWHFAEWGAPIVPEMSIGYVLRDWGKLTAIAAVCWVDDPVDKSLPAGWWAFFDSRGPVSPLAHRYAIKVRDALEAGGADYAYAEADPGVLRSEEWLKRLGFKRWRGSVWRLDFVVDRKGRRVSGERRRSERSGKAGAGCS